MIRLTTTQKQLIKEHYLRHWFYSHMAVPAKEMERRLAMLRLSPEELFVESVAQLDSFLCAPKGFLEETAPSLWDEYYCQLRDSSPRQATTEELELGATELTYMLNYLLCSLADRPMATQVAVTLMTSLMEHPEHFEAIGQCFQPRLWTAHQERFVAALQQYVEGEERLSHEIAHLLRECMEGTPSPRQELPTTDSDADNDDERFTLRQTVMLIQELLNISLAAEDTNLSELSRFIHRLTGHKVESIRTAINKLNKLEQTPQSDLKAITKAIEVFNPDLARDIRGRDE